MRARSNTTHNTPEPPVSHHTTHLLILIRPFVLLVAAVITRATRTGGASARLCRALAVVGTGVLGLCGCGLVNIVL
jgi:hypothetical protein